MKTTRKCLWCRVPLHLGPEGLWLDEHERKVCASGLSAHTAGPETYLQLDVGSAWLVWVLAVLLGSAAGLIARGAAVELWLSIVISGITSLLLWGVGLVILRATDRP